MKIIRIKLIFIVVIISISYIISYAQTDKQLDSLVRSKIRENSQLPNYHPKNDIEIIEQLKINYFRKKDSSSYRNPSDQCPGERYTMKKVLCFTGLRGISGN